VGWNFGLSTLFSQYFASYVGLKNSVLDGQLKPAKHLMKTILKKVTTCIPPVPELTNQGG
jgi:hypothetical protein